MASLDLLRCQQLARWIQRSLKPHTPGLQAPTLPRRVSWAIAALMGSSMNLLLVTPTTAGGLGGSWSEWLPSGATTQSACLSRTRQFLQTQRLVNANFNGTVAYGDINSPLNTSVFMICSDLGDRVLLLVTSRDISNSELQRIRTNLANSFRSQP